MRLALLFAAIAHVGAMQGVERSALGLVSKKLNWKTSIVNEHDKHSHDIDQRRFNGEILAYVTPWNGHGYDVAKRFSGKFAWVAPVWLQLRADAAGAATITGMHDIDDGWVKDVRRACARAAVTAVATAAAIDSGDSLPVPASLEKGELGRTASKRSSRRASTSGPLGADAWPFQKPLPTHCPKIVPRIVWEAPQLSQDEMDKAADLIAAFVERRGFDGVVLEMPVLANTLPWIRKFVTAMHSRLSPAGTPLAVIAVLPPAVNKGGGSQAYGTPVSVIADAVAAGVDRLSVMTYDYSSGRGRVGPNAPINWVRSSARDVIEAATDGVLRDDSFPKDLLEQAIGADALAPGVRDAVDALRAVGLGSVDGDSSSIEVTEQGDTTASRSSRAAAAAAAGGGGGGGGISAKQARRQLARAVASSRVLIGMAMYGHHDAKGTGSPEAITAGTYIDLLKKYKPRMLYDRGSAEHLFRYLPDGVGSGSTVRAVCYYPTLWSVAERLRFAASEGAGVALWEVGQGLDYWYDLM